MDNAGPPSRIQRPLTALYDLLRLSADPCLKLERDVHPCIDIWPALPPGEAGDAGSGGTLRERHGIMTRESLALAASVTHVFRPPAGTVYLVTGVTFLIARIAGTGNMNLNAYVRTAGGGANYAGLLAHSPAGTATELHRFAVDFVLTEADEIAAIYSYGAGAGDNFSIYSTLMRQQLPRGVWRRR